VQHELEQLVVHCRVVAEGEHVVCSVTPGEQLVDPGNLVVGDPAEDVGQPILRIDASELAVSIRL
jgi:hypothetical protein